MINIDKRVQCISTNEYQENLRKPTTDRTVDGKCIKCGGCCTDKLPLTIDEVIHLRNEVQTKGIASNSLINDPNFNWGEFRCVVDHSCPFLLTGGGCRIYDDRPQVCRLFCCNIGDDNWPSVLQADKDYYSKLNFVYLRDIIFNESNRKINPFLKELTDMEEKERMKMSDIERIMAIYSKEWKIPILFTENDFYTGAYLFSIDPDDFERFLLGEDVKYTPEDSERRTFPIIHVVKKMIEKEIEWLEERHIIAMISHEYGHYLTTRKLTNKEDALYLLKTRIIDDLLWFYSEIEDIQMYYEVGKVYQQLPLEKAANEAGNVDVRTLIDLSISGKGFDGDPNELKEPISKLIDYTLGKKDYKILKRVTEEMQTGIRTKETDRDYMNMIFGIYRIILSPEDLERYCNLMMSSSKEEK